MLTKEGVAEPVTFWGRSLADAGHRLNSLGVSPEVRDYMLSVAPAGGRGSIARAAI